VRDNIVWSCRGCHFPNKGEGGLGKRKWVSASSLRQSYTGERTGQVIWGIQCLFFPQG
jgi:hypothetical protein